MTENKMTTQNLTFGIGSEKVIILQIVQVYKVNHSIYVLTSPYQK